MEQPRALPTVSIETHGCKLNQADSQALAQQLTQAGYRVVVPGRPADVYVLNTCTVTHVADRKARQALRAARRRNPNSIIVATGCHVQRAPAELEALDEVDLVIGNGERGVLAQRIASMWGRALDTGNGEREEGTHGVLYHTRAMVKIQEGCNQACTYCIVPRVRGRERSVPPDELVTQVLALQEEGFQEMVLTGTQLGSYGLEMPDASLERLLGLMLNQTTIPRIRVSSLQPQEIGEGLLSLWENPRLCPHFHLPLQSGSDALLRRMGRRYTAGLFADAVERIRKRVPGASITTDVLVGFPGEEEADFLETYRFCQDMGFSGMHVFPYSARPGTAAARFKDRVDPRTRGNRVKLLLSLAKEQARDSRRTLLGQVRPVLWEGAVRKGNRRFWSGLTENYARVLTQDPAALGNTITDVRLVGERDGSLYGKVVS